MNNIPAQQCRFCLFGCYRFRDLKPGLNRVSCRRVKDYISIYFNSKTNIATVIEHNSEYSTALTTLTT